MAKMRYVTLEWPLISVTRGVWVSSLQEKKRYVTLEWPLSTKTRTKACPFRFTVDLESTARWQSDLHPHV